MEILNQNVLDEFVFNLKRNKYKNKIQDLKLESCTGKTGETYIYLALIKIKKSQRTMGYGCVVMNDIIMLANQYNISILLWMSNIYGADLNRLYEFYRKQGFTRIGKKSDNGLIYYSKNKK